MLKLKTGVVSVLCLLAVMVWAEEPAERAPANGAEAAMAPTPQDVPETATVLTNGVAAGTGPVYQMDQFGPVGSVTEANAAFQKASDDILAAGGGILIIPSKTAPLWHAANNSQHSYRIPAAPAPAKTWGTGLGVTVIDARKGTIQIMPPQMSGVEFSRTLNMATNESLPFWGTYPIVSMKNTILRGSTSYREISANDVPPGKDQKFYVSTIRGVFPGMFMSAGDRLFVKSLGYDKETNSWYFTADTDKGIKRGELIGNKNHVNVLKMETYSHAENQTFDVMMWRHNYSQGDNYLVDARFKYMSDVHSTGGDENGVIYGAFVESETGGFQGKVDKWDPATGELKFKGGKDDGKTLGSGRPIINLNPAKWITNGVVRIVRPGSWTETSGEVVTNPVFEGKTYPTTIEKFNKAWWKALTIGGLIHFSADAPITQDAVGRYFTVNDPREMVYGQTYRWYLIDSVTINADGTKDIRIIRHWWGAKHAGAPTLYSESNYTADGHDVPMKYIIAPGANAYDVADGVQNSKHLIKLVPTSFTGTAADFAANDPIEQAIGPDPFKPIPFRSWLWDAVPGIFPAPVFDVANNGVQRDAVLKVHGGGTSLEWANRRPEHKPTWDKYLTFEATCNNGIRFGAETANSAILFAQPNNQLQPIKWYYRPESNQPPREASLTVATGTGEMNFSGGAHFAGSVGAQGLSGGEKAAHNLRGLNVAVPAGSKELSIKFPQPEVDNAYMAVLQLSWLTNHAIVNRTPEGFTVQFATAPTAAGELSWLLVR